MVISMLPMSVFGSAVWHVPGASSNSPFEARNTVEAVTPRIPLNAIWARLSESRTAPGEGAGSFRLVVDLQHARFVTPDGTGFTVLAPDNAIFASGGMPLGTQTVNGMANVAGEANTTLPPTLLSAYLMSVANDGRTGVVEIRYTPPADFVPTTPVGAPPHALGTVLAPTGFVDFTFPHVRSDDSGDWVNATISVAGQSITEDGTPPLRLIDRWNLVWRHEGTVTISVNGGPRGFTSSLMLNPIRVTESLFGTIRTQGNVATLRLTAPQFYTWSFGNNVSATNLDAAFPVTGPITPGRPGTLYPLTARHGGSLTGTSIASVHSVRPNETEARHVIYVNINVGQLDALSPLTGWFEIDNLWLTPDYNAPMQGEVRIDAQLGWMAAATPGTPAVPPTGPTPPIQLYNEFWVRVDADGAPSAAFVSQQRVNDIVRPALVGGLPGSLQVDSFPNGFIEFTRDLDATPPETEAEWNTRRGAVVADTPPTFETSNAGVITPNGNAAALPAGVDPTNTVITVWTNVAQRELFHWVDTTVTPNVSVAHDHANAQLVQRTPLITAPSLPLAMFVRTPGQIIPGQPGSSGSAAIPGDAGGFRQGNIRAGYNAWNLHVGNRGDSTLSAHVYNMQDMRTGHLGTPRGITGAIGNVANPGANTVSGQWSYVQGVNWVPGNRDNGGLPHFTGVPTATLIIEEDSPGAFSVGFGTPIHFEFLDDDGNPHPGIRVLGVQARAGNDNIGRYRGNFRGFDAGTQGFTAPAGNRERQNWMTFAGWMHALDNRLPVVPGVGRISDHRTTIYLPSQTISDVRTPGALEIRFWLSLEAGYEWKHGEDINVTLSGPGIGNLPESQRVQTIGRAVDPIQTNVTDNFPVIDVETGRLYNIVGRLPIADVTVDVINLDAFQLGQELWVYVTSDVLARAGDISLAGIPSINVEGSTLRFDSGRFVQTQVVGGNSAIAFTVTRTASANDEPFITISNLAIEGSVFPGVNYQIVVTGPSVANNEQSIYDQFMGLAHGGVLRHMNRGVFTSLPYHGTIAVSQPGDDQGPGQGQGQGPQVPSREFFLTEGVPFGGVEEPLYWYIVGRNRVGMVSIRAFAYLVGGEDADFDWDSATRVGSVSSLDRNGAPVAISVTEGNPRANIRTTAGDENVDMADYVRGLSGPSGSVYPINRGNRLYLPLRFVAELFGYRVERTGNVVRIF